MLPITILGECVVDDYWSLFKREKDDYFSEDCLIIDDMTVHWKTLSGVTKKKFTLDTPVIDAIWVSFLPNHPNNDLCILYGEGLRIIRDNGNVFSVALPCKMARIWPLPQGLMLERELVEFEVETLETDYPTLFSLLNPLEEVRPFSFLKIDSVDDMLSEDYFVAEPKFKIVYSNQSLPFLVIYEVDTKFHSVWMMRKSGIDDFETSRGIFIDETYIISSNLFIEKIYTVEEELLPAQISLSCTPDTNNMVLYMWIKETQDLIALKFIDAFSVTTYFRMKVLSALTFEALGDAVTISENSDATLPQNLLVIELDGSLSIYSGNLFIGKADFKNQFVGITLTEIDQPIDNRFNIHLSNGYIYRASIVLQPTTFIVQKCFKSIQCVTPSKIFYQLLTSFLKQKSKDRDEWIIFTSLLENLIYNNVSSSEISYEEIDDWEYLLESNYHVNNPSNHFYEKIPDRKKGTNGSIEILKIKGFENSIVDILNALHLTYEDCKINLFEKDFAKLLSDTLLNLSSLLGWTKYVDYYTRDFGNKQLKYEHISHSQLAPRYESPPNFSEWIIESFSGVEISYPMISHILSPISLSRKICRFYTLLFFDTESVLFSPTNSRIYINDTSEDSVLLTPKNYKSPLQYSPSTPIFMTPIQKPRDYSTTSGVERMVFAMIEEKFKRSDLDCLEVGISVPLLESLSFLRSNPRYEIEDEFPPEFYHLVGREDLALQDDPMIISSRKSSITITKDMEKEEITPHPSLKKPAIISLKSHTSFQLFSQDQRLFEVTRVLQSSRHTTINITEHGIGDNDLIAAQLMKLLQKCQRTLSNSIGRGAFNLSTESGLEPLLTESVLIEPLNLSGKTKNAGMLNLDITEFDESYFDWPNFHNGVSVGLRIAEDKVDQISSTWIVYNKPDTDRDDTSHAGFLFGLGLNGHLKVLDNTTIYNYLNSGKTMLSCAIILGISTSHIGTQYNWLVKMLSIHIPSLHPPSSTDMHFDFEIQGASLLGMGFLFLKSKQRRISELLLSEIGKRYPEFNYNRESYSLTAGLALGLVNLGMGPYAKGLADLNMEERLLLFINGGKDHFSTKKNSSTLLQGERINTDITAPGAILALAMMYLKTNNSTLASKMDIPNTYALLDFVRSDFILLRVFAKNLIMWDDIYATNEFIHSQYPDVVREVIEDLPNFHSLSSKEESLLQVYFASVSGGCFSIGFRYAGTQNLDVRELLISYLDYFNITTKKFAKKISKSSKKLIEYCLNVIVISLSLVMAGSGDLNLFKIFRKLRKRVNEDVTYGNHMSISMAIGFLFLGGGRYTFSRSDEAIASLIISMYPTFPSSTVDNQYHYQGFRHLYVLAAELRCIECIDISTDMSVNVPISVIMKPDFFGSDLVKINLITPCIVPELRLIREIQLSSNDYWERKLIPHKNKLHKKMLQDYKVIYVKKRSPLLKEEKDSQNNFLPYSVPVIADTEKLHWNSRKEYFVSSILSNSALKSLSHYFYHEGTIEKLETSVPLFFLYDCLRGEKPEMLSVYLKIFNSMTNLEKRVRNSDIIGIKIISAYCKRYGSSNQLINPQFLNLIQTKLKNYLSREAYKMESYINDGSFSNNSPFGCYLSYYNIPDREILQTLLSAAPENATTLQHLLHLSNTSLPPETILELAKSFHTIKTT